MPNLLEVDVVDVENQLNGESNDIVEFQEASLSIADYYEHRSNEIETFLMALRAEKQIRQASQDASVFSSLLRLAVQEYGLQQSDLAAVLHISAGQISRWCSGASAPKPYVRDVVIDVAADLIEERIQSLRAEAKSLTD